ncbi:MAG: MFS transporter [Ktedonobacteraceae bacterium]|nr:MFS transporter [Ktedonobacteraceae bacterium]
MLFLNVLRHRHLALLWGSQVLSAMGDYFYQIAVVWIAVKVAGSSGSIVIAAEVGSAFCCGLLGGVYADRWNRRTTMIVVDLLRALAVGMLPWLAQWGTLQLWYLVLVAIVVGGLSALFNPALQASLPALAGDPRLLQATNGLMDTTRRLARALSPSLAGLLVLFIPLAHFLTLDAVSFLISALAIFFIGSAFAWQPDPGKLTMRGVSGIIGDLAQSFSLVRGHPELRWTLLSMGIIDLAWSAAFVIGVPLFADQVLKSGVGTYGLIVGAYGTVNVLSNIVVSHLIIKRRMRTIMLGKLIIGGGFLLMVATPYLPLILFSSALASIGGPMGDIPYTMMIQMDIPSHHLGKVYSLDQAVSNTGGMLGLLLAAPLYQWMSVPLGIACFSLLFVVIGIAGLLRFRATKPAIYL